jgi:putative two-component system response regulator
MVRSSPLHDIGKVGTPDHILLKPGRLTPEEFEVMKRHSVIGGDAIRDLIAQGRTQPFLQMGMEIAYHHHEKYDGSGYPAGLAGQDIPLPARIMALADVYDALTSRRPYKDPMPHERAAAIIREGRGYHFDPDVVDAFDAREAAFQQMALTLKDDDASNKPAPPVTDQTMELVAAAG